MKEETTRGELVSQLPLIEGAQYSAPRPSFMAWLPLVAGLLVALAVASYFVAWLLWVIGAAVAGSAAYLLLSLAWRAYTAIDGHKEHKADRRLTRELAIEEARLARYQLETARLAALAAATTLEAGDGATRRQTRIMPNGRTLAAELGHGLPVNVPNTYSPRIEISNPAQGSASLAPVALAAPSSGAIPDKVELLDNLATLRGRGLLNLAELTLYLGESAHGAALAATGDILMAAIVAGTGGGKSMFLRDLLYQWFAYWRAGAGVEFVLIDHDRRELPLWEHAPNLFKWLNPETGGIDTAFSDDSERTEHLIASLVGEMERRARLPEEERARLPYLIIAIEEIIDVFGDINAAARAGLEKLMRRSRGVNFRIVCTAQYLRVEDVGKAVQSQSRSKFAGSLADDRATAQTLGFDLKIVPSGQAGRFTFRLPDGRTGIVQTPHIAAEDVRALLAAAPGPVASDERRASQRPTLTILRGADVSQPATGGGGGALTDWLNDVPTFAPTPLTAPSRETKEDAARRLWGEGFTSIRKLSDELTKLGYPGVSSPDSARALINRLGLRIDGQASGQE